MVEDNCVIRCTRLKDDPQTLDKNLTISDMPSITTENKQSGWAPLAYPLSAFKVPIASGFEKSSSFRNDIQTLDPETISHVSLKKDVNPYFPLHKYVLFVLIRDLLFVDGGINPKTMELIKSKCEEDPQYLRHWDPDWKQIKQEHEEDLEGKREVVLSDNIDGTKSKKLKSDDTKLKTNVKKSTPSSHSETHKQEMADLRNSKSVTLVSNSEMNSNASTVGQSLPRLKKKRRIAQPIVVPSVSPCLSNSNVSNVSFEKSENNNKSNLSKGNNQNQIREIIVIEGSDSEDDDLPSCAEELTMKIVSRAVITDVSKHVCNAIIPNFIHSSSNGIHVKRSRLVSDADTLSNQNDRQTVSKGFTPDFTIPCSCVQYSAKQQLLHVSIFHEEHLRSTAYNMTLRALESFSTRSLRTLLNYRSNSIPRQKMIQLLSTVLFNASHAMYAWDQTEAELILERNEIISSRSMGRINQEELDDEIVKLLFNERDLRKIGGFKSSSILPTALLISRIAKRNMSWARFSETGYGRKVLMERSGKGNKHGVSIGWIGAWRKIRQRSMENTVKQSRPKKGSKKSSMLKSDVNENHRSKEFWSGIMSSIVSIRLTRDCEEKAWGVKLARERQMCVVMKVSEENANIELKEGDIITEVKSNGGNTFYAPYSNSYNAQKFDPFYGCKELPDETQDLSQWFKRVVEIFKSSQELDLKVIRVSAA